MIPWGDWQFWVVTLVAAAAAWWVLRTIVPERLWAKVGIKKKPRGRAASLTVEGKTPEKK